MYLQPVRASSHRGWWWFCGNRGVGAWEGPACPSPSHRSCIFSQLVLGKEKGTVEASNGLNK